MKVKEKINMDGQGLRDNGPINIVAFGDSVTHGCLNGTCDYENVYWNVLKKKLNAVRDTIPINVIDSGIGGISAQGSLYRFDRDVAAYHPDLVIVCFGLNDVNGGKDDYLNSLREIFAKCKEHGFDVIFMTPNMLNTYVAEGTPEQHRDYAAVTAKLQNEGRMDDYIYSAIEVAKEMNVTVCDCYSRWREMYDNGVDTTQLLINKINHPTSEMHKLFADMLFDIIMGDCEDINQSTSDGMYSEN